jgi:hypothetical protein
MRIQRQQGLVLRQSPIEFTLLVSSLGDQKIAIELGVRA